MRIYRIYISTAFGKFHDLSVYFRSRFKRGKRQRTIAGEIPPAHLHPLHAFWSGSGDVGVLPAGTFTANMSPGRTRRLRRSGCGWRRPDLSSTVWKRNFQKDQKTFVIVMKPQGKEVEPTRVSWIFLLGGLTENGCITIPSASGSSICGGREGGMVTELRKLHCQRLNTTRQPCLQNITKATSYLKNRRKEYRAPAHPEAAAPTLHCLTRDQKPLKKRFHRPPPPPPPPEIRRTSSRPIKTALPGARTSFPRTDGTRDLLRRLPKGVRHWPRAQFTDEASIHAISGERRNNYAIIRN